MCAASVIQLYPPKPSKSSIPRNASFNSNPHIEIEKKHRPGKWNVGKVLSLENSLSYWSVRANIVLISYSKTTWPTNILVSFLSFLDSLLYDAYTTFPPPKKKKRKRKKKYNFEISHKTCSILFWVAVPPKLSPRYTNYPWKLEINHIAYQFAFSVKLVQYNFQNELWYRCFTYSVAIKCKSANFLTTFLLQCTPQAASSKMKRQINSLCLKRKLKITIMETSRIL